MSHYHFIAVRPITCIREGFRTKCSLAIWVTEIYDNPEAKSPTPENFRKISFV